MSIPHPSLNTSQGLADSPQAGFNLASPHSSTAPGAPESGAAALGNLNGSKIIETEDRKVDSDLGVSKKIDIGRGKGVGFGVKKEEEEEAAAAGLRGENGYVIHQDETLRKGHQKLESIVFRIENVFDNIYLRAKPYTNKLLAIAEAKPLLFTFSAIWLSFSAIPIVVFTGFILLSIATILAVAVSTLLVLVVGTVVLTLSAIVATLVFASFFLLPTLFVTTTFSAISISFLLGLFFVYRLYQHVSSATQEGLSFNNLGRGVGGWAGEVGDRVGEVADYAYPFQSTKPPSAVVSSLSEKLGLPTQKQAYSTGQKGPFDEKATLRAYQDPPALSEKVGLHNNYNATVGSQPVVIT
ncbi:hypothetical protein L202_02801 [Cryptococcus amylolentus CBS 6039]|uniref:Uncharacterized protein n=2 Tax=Cryptococcus amylolentus TaxID=104669 RepID=A0A1E3HYI3_9TREE|nr:hypothetical protein L202_02801 [Cryptococcus amylolentus CBS 6039]ODN80611.1 hypothetical protein L202_02801 [Cryptococcus amylolentus CBS 6039]ODO09177.1 hypothetical protein I350_02777 [Cryptococcus amylolentus CBS 6273]